MLSRLYTVRQNTEKQNKTTKNVNQKNNPLLKPVPPTARAFYYYCF